MNWQDLGAKLIRFGAPTIGTALGGPLGGTIGGVVGNLIANQLGVEATPQAVATAIETDPNAAAKLAAADAQWQAIAEIGKADAADRTGQSQAINTTIQAEIPHVSWWHWRHLLGYVTLLWFIIPLPAFARLTITFNAEASAALVQTITVATPLLGIMAALLGYVAQDTTKLKTTAITGETPTTVLGAIKAAVKRK